MDAAMLLLLLVLVGLVTYILFCPTSFVGPWLDKYCKREKDEWSGDSVYKDQDGVPFVTPVEQKSKKRKRKYKKRIKK
mgnify:CR=1 FL=1|tara:strand:- start:609 stop:842 length:234 start_codon:yes stop_codon:yes gene_type:complete